MHLLTLISSFFLATAIGSPAPEAETKVNSGPNDVTFYIRKDYQDVYYTFVISPGSSEKISSGKCVVFQESVKNKVASASSATRSNIEFCQVFADTKCSIFGKFQF